jgi:hypothetical protein
LTWKRLEDKDWSKIYGMPSVPGYSDIQLMVDQLSFEVQVFQNWSYSLEFPTSSECGWTAVPLHNETLNIDVIHFEKEGTVAPNPRQSSRFFVRSDEFLGNTTAFPEVKWPDPYLIKANNTVTLANYSLPCYLRASEGKSIWKSSTNFNSVSQHCHHL